MLGPDCCENPPTPCSSCGSGRVEQIGALNSYVSGAPDSKFSVLLVSDVFGYEAPNLRKVADKVAAAGFYVVVPDLFRGEPFHPEKNVQDWLRDHAPDQAVESAKSIVQALKSKGISKVGAAGFCWGGKVVVELAKDTDIQAAVLLHPSFVTVDDIKGVKVPIAILGAETDHRSPPEVVKQFEVALEAKPEIDRFVKIYPGVSHGWTLRYKDEDEVIVKCAEEAHQDLLDWFVKCLR